MPYAGKTDDDLPKCVETGQTALTGLLNGRASDLEALEEHPHWEAFKEPGHLRKLDDGCVAFFGLSEELVEHLRHAWPPIGTDLAHLAIVNAVLDRVPVRFSWKPARGSETSVSADDTGAVLDVRIFSPVVGAPAAREPVAVLA